MVNNPKGVLKTKSKAPPPKKGPFFIFKKFTCQTPSKNVHFPVDDELVIDLVAQRENQMGRQQIDEQENSDYEVIESLEQWFFQDHRKQTVTESKEIEPEVKESPTKLQFESQQQEQLNYKEEEPEVKSVGIQEAVVDEKIVTSPIEQRVAQVVMENDFFVDSDDDYWNQNYHKRETNFLSNLRQNELALQHESTSCTESDPEMFTLSKKVSPPVKTLEHAKSCFDSEVACIFSHQFIPPPFFEEDSSSHEIEPKVVIVKSPEKNPIFYEPKQNQLEYKELDLEVTPLVANVPKIESPVKVVSSNNQIDETIVNVPKVNEFKVTESQEKDVDVTVFQKMNTKITSPERKVPEVTVSKRKDPTVISPERKVSEFPVSNKNDPQVIVSSKRDSKIISPERKVPEVFVSNKDDPEVIFSNRTDSKVSPERKVPDVTISNRGDPEVFRDVPNVIKEDDTKIILKEDDPGVMITPEVITTDISQEDDTVTPFFKDPEVVLEDEMEVTPVQNHDSEITLLLNDTEVIQLKQEDFIIEEEEQEEANQEYEKEPEATNLVPLNDLIATPKPSTSLTTNKTRQELLGWINDLMQSNVAHVEELGTGVMYCLLMNQLQTGSIPLNKIKVRAQLEAAYIQNFTMLQDAFRKLRVNMVIPMDKLVKCRFSDNLEFIQWFKKFFEANYKGLKPFGHLNIRKGGPLKSRRTDKKSKIVPPNNNPVTTPISVRRPFGVGLSPQMEHVYCQMADVRLKTTMVTNEKNFYYKKLLQIENLLCDLPDTQANEEDTQNILEILYVTQYGFKCPAHGLEDPVQRQIEAIRAQA